MIDYQMITRKYYAEWLDCDASDFDGGVRYVCSSKRDVALYGHSYPMSLSIFDTGSAVVISYSSKFREQINQMQRDCLTYKSFGSRFVEYLNSLFPEEEIERSIKFVFAGQPSHPGEGVVPLSRNDFNSFRDFRLSLGQSEWDGMREYFENISDMRYCIAKIIDEKPVSMTDAPGMAFMPDMAQEIGINTLPGYRRRGYAREVVSACILKILLDSKCPMWSCDADNLASEKLAYSVGFNKFSDEYHIDIR